MLRGCPPLGELQQTNPLGESLVIQPCYPEQTRIKLETAAKLELQAHIKAGDCRLLWSAVLDYECSRNPYPEHQFAIFKWRDLACTIIQADHAIQQHANQLVSLGIGSYDALHAASANSGSLR